MNSNDYSEITIRGDADPLKESIDDAVGMFKSFGDRVSKVMQAITGAANFDDLWAKVKEGVGRFEEFGRMMNRIEYQLKALGGRAGLTKDNMVDMNKQLQKVTGANSEAIASAQSALLEFSNVRYTLTANVFQKAIAGAADLAEVLGTDLTSATTKLGGALQDPIEGLDTLGDAGLRFDAKQKRLVETYARSGNMVQAQLILLKELSDTYGGAASKQAQSFGARLERLNEYFDQTWTKIGGFLVPYLNVFIDAVEKVNRVLDHYQAKVVAYFEGMIGGGTKLKTAEEYLKQIADVGVYAASVIQAAWENPSSFIIGGLTEIWKVATSVFKKVTDVFFTFVQTMTPIWTVVGQAAASTWETVKDAASKAFKYLAQLGSWLLGEMKKVFKSLFDMTVVTFKNIGGVAAATWHNVLNPNSQVKINYEFFGTTFKNGIKNSMPKIDMAGMPKMPGASLGDAGSGMMAAAQKMFENLKNGAKDMWDGVEKSFVPFLDSLDLKLFQNGANFDQFWEKIKSIMAGDPYAEITGKGSDKGFKGPGSGDEHGGAFEDIVQLNKRIQGAAAKSPLLTEMQKQTALQGQANKHLAGIANNTKGGGGGGAGGKNGGKKDPVFADDGWSGNAVNNPYQWGY